MEAYDRFLAVVTLPSAAVRLDEAALCIAAVTDPPVDVDAYLGRLDALAATCPAPTLDALVTHLFRDQRFSGNRDDYYDPRNSMLHHVIDRRVGIPVSLSVVTMEVGRRLGVPLWGVGLPGHFLVRDKVDPSVFVDPFHGGRFLDEAGCRRLYRSLAGPDAPWNEAHLDPIDRPSIIARMLINLKAIYARRNDLDRLRQVMRLRLAVPGTPPGERDEFARLMAPTN